MADPRPSRPSADPPEMAEHDERLAELLAELTDRVLAGETVNLEQQCTAHPDLAEDLRQLWGAVMVADAAGGQARSSDSASTHPDQHDAIFELPYQFGDYKLLEELGRGGMGVVYRAQQVSLNREVAVKMILRGQLASEADRERFRAEAEAAARLDHPGIVKVYEVGEWKGRPYFSMQVIPGETLATRLADGPLPAQEAAGLLNQVARAIHFAHQRGVLHRDLKPSNILIDHSGRAHVSDFGLAKQVTGPASLTRSGAVLGTPSYMAPEQAAGARGEVGPASDVYSMGSILYHMLTGRPPFQAANPVDAVLMVLEQDPVLPRMLNPRADRDLEMIALRCLQKPTDLRYSTAEKLAQDLEAYLADEPISARSGRFAQIAARFFRETHHAAVLENWGLLWMWHSLALLIVCVLTNLLIWLNDLNRWHYAGLWILALWTWAGVFWMLRRRMGPVTFIERQIAHLWAASMVGIALLFPLEYWLGLEALTLSPVLAVISGMVFLAKAGMLSGAFYLQAAALFAIVPAMARWPQFAHLIFGVVSAACFFLPGLKYYRQRRASEA